MARQVSLIDVPVDYGANRRGVDMGPSAIRYAGLGAQLSSLGIDCQDADNITAPAVASDGGSATVSDTASTGSAADLDEIRVVTDRLSEQVASAIDGGSLPLVLGGDHSVAIGSLRGSAQDGQIGAIWFDAHGDFNTPSTSPSGNVHGMPLAAALGIGDFEGESWANAPGLREENLVLVGIRSLDAHERAVLSESRATVFTMSDIDRLGIDTVVDRALDIATDGVDGIHVSLDLDWLDPREAPGVGTPVRGGVDYREAHTALEQVAQRDTEEDILRSFELVEVNPILDTDNRTAEMAAELAASALGKDVL